MKKLRLIQCGVGSFGKVWINETTKSPDFDLVAIVDASPQNLEEGGAIAGLPPEKRFAGLEEALNAVEADAVLTVTPPPVHAAHSRLAFARGLHLMTEKPIADTMENAREMVRLAREAGRQLVISQQYRYRPSIQKLKQLVSTKALGELGHGHLDFYIAADFTGSFRETMEFPLLVDMAIHHLDLIRCVTGRDITRVTACSFNPPWSWYRHDCGLKLLMELEGGLPFSYSGDWSAFGRATSWNGNWRLQCSEGSLHLEDDTILAGRSERWGKEVRVEEIPAPPAEYGDQAHTLRNFAEAIRAGIPAETDGMDNLQSFGAVIAAIRSAQEGRAVAIQEIIRGQGEVTGSSS